MALLFQFPGGVPPPGLITSMAGVMPGMPPGGPRLDMPTSMALGAGLPATPRPDHMSQAAAAAAASNAAAAAAAAQAAAAASSNGPSSDKIKVSIVVQWSTLAWIVLQLSYTFVF